MPNPETFEVFDLLDKYKGRLKTIGFLKGSSLKDIEDKLKKLMGLFPKGVKDKEESLDWHEAHEIGRDLWRQLISAAINSIDENSKGNSKLFEYLDDATKFEDLLYGLDPYYRDHTLHSLWVYFLGDQLLNNDLKHVYEQLNWYLFNDIKRDEEKYQYKTELVNFSKIKKELLCNEVNKHKDAIWCIIALCHDLGYSLAKLNRLNASVQKVLEYYDVPDFRHVGYSLDIEHQYLMSQFLELMCMDVRIEPSEKYDDPKKITRGAKKWLSAWNDANNGKYSDDERKEKVNSLSQRIPRELENKISVKCYKDDSTYWRLCRALEKKEHGILSAYLIYKILGIFAESSVRGPAEEWGLDDAETQRNIIRGDILFAIAQHGFDFAHLNQLGSLADLLIIADELEEFTRYGRQLASRKYTATTAKTSIEFRNPQNNEGIKPGQDIEIDIAYYCKHKQEEHFLDFFRRKAEKRLCSIYSLKPTREEKAEEEKDNYCTITSIKMNMKWEDPKDETNKKEYWFKFSSDGKLWGGLPEYKLDDRDSEMPEEGYELKSYDDELRVYYDGKEIKLKKWLGLDKSDVEKD